ncbi:MAG: phage minor capsid protein [Eubacteriales bacterium]|nr:phage minor capsid protein [Eubacteriales bacterium]
MTQGELEQIPLGLQRTMSELEIRIMTDIVRRIENNGFSGASADWQINRLKQLGMAQKEIERYIQDAMKDSDVKIDEIFSDKVYEEYYGHSRAYQNNGVEQIPYEENEQLQQLVEGLRNQTEEEFRNMTGSLGFAIRDPSGKIQYSPLRQFYESTLDSAMMDIHSGAFDYQTVLTRVISQMTNSGLRWIDYDSGWHNRVDVAARRAVMTGFRQIQGKINEQVANELNTDMYEVTFHVGARPEHQEWQGRVYSMDELISVCGLGDVTGLHGANCYHDYKAFPPGSVRTYTDEQLDQMNAEENKPKTFNGREYTTYEALQMQRKMETAMRATRQQIHLLKEGKADEQTIIAKKAKYQGQMQTYKAFSQKMKLPEQKDRILQDGLKGRFLPTKGELKQVAVEKNEKSIAMKMKSDTIKERGIANRNMANGMRTSSHHVLTDGEIESVKQDARILKIPEGILCFNKGNQTGFSDTRVIIHVRGDILPDIESRNLRDQLSQRAVLAHEYYGHYMSHPSKFRVGDWRDEFRASYKAAKYAPGLTDEERRMLMLDAYDRAREAGVTVKYNKYARRMIYGYDE